MNNKAFEKMVNYRIKDKGYGLRKFVQTMLNKTNQIFEYRNLPKSIPDYKLEEYLQTSGIALITRANDGEIYAFFGSIGGEMDVYYRPKTFFVNNPWINFNKEVKIGEEGVLIRNDTYMEGLLPLMYKYGTLLVEADISFRSAIINTRYHLTIDAPDDKTKISAEEYIKKVERGDNAVIGSNAFFEGIRTHPTSGNNKSLADLRETYQYLKAQLYSDLGMKTQHNMKNQYVSNEENIINDDSLLPLIDNMLKCREEAVKEINEMFDLNIEVKLRGTWELQQEEVEAALEALQNPEIEEEEEQHEESESTIETEDERPEEGREYETARTTEEEEEESEESKEGVKVKTDIDIEIEFMIEEEMKKNEETEVETSDESN